MAATAAAPVAPANPPSADTLLLLATLSNPAVTPHETHTQALEARDRALAASPASYGSLCLDFARTLALANPSTLPENITAQLAQASSPALQQLQVDPNQWIALRQMAGLLLKNAISVPPPANPASNQTDGLGRPAGGYMQLPPECAAEIKPILLRCIADSNPNVRRAASSTASAASVSYAASPFADVKPRARVVSLPLSEWPELLPNLLECINSGLVNESNEVAAAAMDGSLLTLRKMLEDSPQEFEQNSGPAFANLIPLLLRTFQSPSERVKKEGLKCLNSLIETMPGSLAVHMNDYLGGLSALATDASWEIRRLVCQAIVTMLSLRTEYLQPHFTAISEFILNATSDANEDVALEACEFWLTFASLEEEVCSPDMYEYIQHMLPRLIPVLLKGMVYTEEKREELLEAAALDESNATDRSQDVAPIFHNSSAKRGDDDESDDDDDPDDDNEWNMRKCSAASLDSLASVYGPEYMLPPLLPGLQEGLAHSDPWIREAGVLALGAIADGCSDAMVEHMGQLHPFLMAQLMDPNSIPPLKSISAWCLGRYAEWAVDQVHKGQPDILGKMTEALMGRALDTNRTVQVAMCSAFGVIVETAGDLLAPYLEPVYRTLAQAMTRYHTRSLITLFDIMGTIADCCGPIIGEGSLPSIFVPPLLQIWHQLARNNPLDRTILPLVECLASTALVMGANYQPWALQTFDGAMSMIERCLMHLSTMEDQYSDEEADPIVCAADLLDGLAEGLGDNFPALLSSSSRYGEHFLGVLHTLIAHDVAGVRMSAFALFGDLARKAPSVIQPGMHELMTEAVACIDPMYPSVCNNAVWAIGEICSRCEKSPDSLKPYKDDIVHNLINLLMGNAVDGEGHTLVVPGIAENASACMGRLAKANPAFVGPDLGRFLLGWCEGMAKIFDPIERRDAFQGFVVALRSNPQALRQAGHDPSSAITAILFAISSWHVPEDGANNNIYSPDFSFRPFPPEEAELGSALATLLQEIKSSISPDSWNTVEKSMPVNIRRLFRENYGL